MYSLLLSFCFRYLVQVGSRSSHFPVFSLFHLMSTRFICVVTNDIISFFVKAKKYPHYGYSTFLFPIHLLMHTRLSLCFSYCEWCCNEHESTDNSAQGIFGITASFLLRIYFPSLFSMIYIFTAKLTLCIVVPFPLLLSSYYWAHLLVHSSRNHHNYSLSCMISDWNWNKISKGVF